MNVRILYFRMEGIYKKYIFSSPFLIMNELVHSQTHNESVETAYYTIENLSTYTINLDIFEHVPYMKSNPYEP